MRFDPTGTNALVLLAALALACSGQSDASGEGGGSSGPAVTVPSEQEAQRRASEDIDDENADDEFERLRREIEGEE